MRKKTPKKSPVAVSINIFCDIVPFNRKKMIKMAQNIIRKFKIRKAKVNLAVLPDKEIIRINRRFLKKKKNTDCISFNLSEKNIRIFDIAVNAQMARRQAKLRGHNPESELALYFLHGLLHNLGFNDSSQAGASRMHEAEDKILQKFGYGFVYKSEPRR